MAAQKTDVVFFDSNVYIYLLRSPEYERKISRFLQGSALYAISKIVLMELWAGVRDKTQENILKQHQNSLPLLVFSDDNFIVAGQVMRKMTTEHDFEPRIRRRLTWDILIALNAKENNALLVTENESDFRKVQRFVNFEFVTPGDES
ncbi:MAG: PIN domain-containing protein [Deltaproteobacteria bacterium]|nr:PIN domain-containing protein [Deltaproteobacteria bacterium]